MNIEVKKALIVLFGSKGINITEEKSKLIKLWFGLIKKYKLTDQEVLYAVEKLMIKSTYGLQFADLYEIVRPDNTYDDALKIWSAIRRCVRHRVPFIKFHKELINKFTTCAKVADADSKELDFMKNDFVKIYKMYAHEKKIKDYLLENKNKKLLEDIDGRE